MVLMPKMCLLVLSNAFMVNWRAVYNLIKSKYFLLK